MARDIQTEGMTIAVDSADPSHALILNLNASNRHTHQVQQWKVKMATELCVVLNPDSGQVVWKKT